MSYLQPVSSYPKIKSKDYTTNTNITKTWHEEREELCGVWKKERANTVWPGRLGEGLMASAGLEKKSQTTTLIFFSVIKEYSLQPVWYFIVFKMSII